MKWIKISKQLALDQLKILPWKQYQNEEIRQLAGRIAGNMNDGPHRAQYVHKRLSPDCNTFQATGQQTVVHLVKKSPAITQPKCLLRVHKSLL